MKKINKPKMSITLQVGNRVEVTGKNVQGEIAYIGTTMFAGGKWIGIILDEPKGKNNGTVQGKSYFQCKENHGVFVRQSQLTLVTDTGSRIDLSGMSSSVTSPDDIPKTTPKSRLTSSRQSLSGKNRDSRSREDMSSSTTSLIPEPSSKRASFVEPSKLRSPMGRSGTPITPRRPTKTLIPTSEKKKQTGFVETLNPQFTPGEIVSTPVTPSLVPVQPPRLLQPEPNPEMESLREQIKDLSEKLETLKIKYKEKSHDLDSLRIQLDQSAEFKARIMESQAALKKELDRAKRERQEALEEREEYSELADTLEMATLDKEMAEEKAESLHKELEQANERIEELEMELEVLKAELAEKIEGVVSDNTVDPQVSSFKLKQLEQQNEKLKDTLVRLRDLSAHEKHEKQKLLKDFEEKKADLDQLSKYTDKLKGRLAEMEEEIAELHSNVDAALGAEEMVETLGQQKLSLEEKVKELEEAVAELEELQEVNDQLQEGFKEQEQDFRQELDLKNLQVWEAQRKTESVLESLADRELTIVKFRELVQRMQEENQELRSQLESSSKTTVTTLVPEFLEFKKMFAETKAHARAIDLELRHMEVQQAQLHVQYLVAFMPDSFLTRGGDNDAVLIVLLMPRLLTKCQVLLTQLRDKYPAVDTVQRATLNHSVHQFAARSRFAMHLHMLQAILRQFVHGLNTCTPETLLKVGASYPDMMQQEKLLDGYIDLLKRDQLDENVSTENLERVITYFNTVHPALLLVNSETEIHEGQLLSDLGKALLCGVDSINTDAAIIQVLIQNGNSSSDVVALCQQIASWCETARQHLRQVRRRLDLLTDLQGLGDLVQVCYTVLKMAKILAETAKASMAQVPSTTDSESLLPPKKVLDQLTQSYDKYSEDDKEKGVIAYLKLGMESVSMQIANTALTLQENEEKFLASKEEKATKEPPLALRARAVKHELNATGGLRKQLEHRESDIRELKMTLRNKQEELGEISLRRDIAEKKLANITKEHELTVETLKRKLEESHQQLKRKEKEFEETMDHLQKDIDSLEMEKGELKDKLKNYPKKSIDTVKSGPTSIVGENQGSVKIIESPLLVSEIRFLKSALKQERVKRTSLEAKHYLEILDRLGPIHVPKKVKPSDDELNRVNELTKKVLTLQHDMLHSLPKVLDISKKKAGMDSNIIEQHIIRENLKKKELNHRLSELQVEVMNEVIKQKKGGFIQTDLTVFPTPEMVKAVHEQDPVLVCEVIVPTVDPSLSGKIIPLEVDMKSLDLLKQKLFALGP